VVEVQLPADELAYRMTEMRAWLARHKAPTADIAYTKTPSLAIVRVNLATASEAETFATRFGGRILEE